MEIAQLFDSMAFNHFGLYSRTDHLVGCGNAIIIKLIRLPIILMAMLFVMRCFGPALPHLSAWIKTALDFNCRVGWIRMWLN